MQGSCVNEQLPKTPALSLNGRWVGLGPPRISFWQQDNQKALRSGELSTRAHIRSEPPTLRTAVESIRSKAFQPSQNINPVAIASGVRREYDSADAGRIRRRSDRC